MKNLRLLNRAFLRPESRTYPDLQVTASVFNPVTHSITVAFQGPDMVEVQQFGKTGSVNIIASFPIAEGDRLISFVEFSDLSQLIFTFEKGDIICATFDPESPDPDLTTVEIVGSVDCGFLAASWSYDEETLALLTMENKLLLLSRTFEPISESALNPEDVAVNNQVSVGWGKKETQFKGRGMKAVEREKIALMHAGVDFEKDPNLRDPTLTIAQNGDLSPFETFDVRLSWRGDCEYLSVSCVESVGGNNRRVIRVYSRSGELDSCSEAVDGHEGLLAWKPQGSLIASTQTTTVRREDEFGGEFAEEVTSLIFFERNGLRHGEFETRMPVGAVKDLAWSCNSEVLAFQLDNSVVLWTTKNYHWYLKQEISTRDKEPIRFIKFHPEKPLQLMIGTSSSIEIFDFAYSIASGPTSSPHDLGMVAVVDGSSVGLTPLSVANVPPPISYRSLEFELNVNDVAVSRSNRVIGCVGAEGLVFSELVGDRYTPKEGPLLNRSIFHLDDAVFRQIAIARDDLAAVLVDFESNSSIVLFDITDPYKPELRGEVTIDSNKCLLLKARSDFETITFETIDGKVYEIDDNEATASVVAEFPQLCNSYELVKATADFDWTSEEYFAFGANAAGKMFANDQIIYNGVTSLVVTESHLLFTTAQHQLQFVHLADKSSFYSAEGLLQRGTDDERTRMIERGSLLVSAMPSKSAVVLQAPRGNLETIYPRIMVLSEVRADISKKEYRKAFLTCRVHRIDLDILYDYNPTLFLDNVQNFVKDLDSIDHLNLFVSCLHEEDVTLSKYKETLRITDTAQLAQELSNVNLAPKEKEIKKQSKVNIICEAILAVLLRPEYQKKYLQTIITTYACQNPPNLEDALSLISTLTSESEIDDAIEHLCFLQDVNKLYNISLGLYNIPVTLIIAQKSTKDPKEYLPFLQNLHIQPELRKKFLIDTHLENYEKALDSLTKISTENAPNVEAEILDYIVEHSLYQHALTIYRYKPAQFLKVLRVYADYLHDQGNFQEAAITCEQLGLHEDAIENYTLAKSWREAIALTLRPELKEALHIKTCESLVSLLTEAHKYADAAFIEFKYLHNISAAVSLYCKDFFYDEAILLCVTEGQSDLVEKLVDPALGEGFGTIAELIADCDGQAKSQLKRLRELRAKKEEDPNGFYGSGVDDADHPDNVSIAASETSTKESFFTRYTGKTAGTAKTGASRRTAKNRRREERKRARGKKGTIYEEEYLVKSVGRLIERLDSTQPEAKRLIEALLRRGMREQAYQIQKTLMAVLDFLKENVNEIFDISERDRERIDEDGLVYYIPEIPAPEIKPFKAYDVLDY